MCYCVEIVWDLLVCQQQISGLADKKVLNRFGV